jgi:hypothetical protein
MLCKRLHGLILVAIGLLLWWAPHYLDVQGESVYVGALLFGHGALAGILIAVGLFWATES